jgi:signal transduction histidine kinase/CheY-like chemotaxis protein
VSSRKRVLIALGVAVLYVACAKLGLALAFRAAQVTAVWPPTAFALVAVLRYGRPAIFGVLLGAFIANATASEPLLVAAGIAIGNTLEALVGAWLLRRASFDGRLARVRDVIALLGALAIAPIVSATIGVASLTIGGVQPVSAAPALWWIWWLGDALGGLIFGPLLFVISDRDRMPRRDGALAEGALLLLGTIAASMLVFLRSPSVMAVEYVIFPFVIWAALRFGPAGSAAAAVTANAIAVLGTHAGLGPFANAGPEHGLVLLQIFMAVAATTSLLLGAIAAQNRKSQERAELSERRLLMAIDGARIVAWDWDIGSEEHDAYRKRIHADDRARVDSAIKQAIATSAPYEAEFRRAANGHWIDARGTTIDEGRMIGVDIDVTRQKELEEELRLQDRRKDEFLAMLAHELRNPLAPIIHATSLLGTGDAGEAREVIRRQSQHLARLVDDLLDVSRITRGSVHLERRAVALSEIVRAATDMWRHYIEEKNLRLSIEVDERPVWIDADPLRLTQVLANLVHNAAKFTPPGGRVDVMAGVIDGAACVRVRDSGQGMSGDVLEHAFELFVQGPPPLDRPHGGLGLGLTLVRRLIELHGGTVEARSDGAERGSEFIVRLPVASPPPAAKSAAAMRAEHRMRRVLLVEDHADARRILALMLTRSGHDVRTAEDGPGALAEARRFAPEVVLLDIGLPGMDGYAVARQLRTMPQCGGARLIALTGYGQAEDREQSREAGFDEHLLKPVEPANLLALINN